MIAVGDPFNGLQIYGPFADDAARYQFTAHSPDCQNETWWYVDATAPPATDPSVRIEIFDADDEDRARVQRRAL